MAAVDHQAQVGEPVQVTPLHRDDTWNFREVRLCAANQAAFDIFARHTEGTDYLVVHRDSGEQVIMMSTRFWLRVLATVCVASGQPAPTMTVRA